MRNQSLTANHFNKINDYKVCLLKKREKSHVRPGSDAELFMSRT